MKNLIVALLAVLGLAGCVAVPAPYYSGPAYYYHPVPAVGVGIHAGSGHHHHVPRHRRHPHRW